MRLVLRSVIAIAALLCLASAKTNAQVSRTSSPVLTASSTVAAGPTLLGATAGVRPAAPAVSARTSLESALPQDPRLGTGRNMAMVIVGSGAFVTGLVIGGDAGAILSVGGAVVALYGLYQIMK
ncbi:MAG TPA: hypothetical protein VMM77_07645 [Gemmatimonadaceae bacterium]|nr:hypothetical protein [Gemmatimonadaceae bacterium]